MYNFKKISLSGNKLKKDNPLKTTVIFGFIGFLIGMYFNNIILSCVLMVGLTYIPSQYRKLRKVTENITMNERLEPVMNAVTASYIQSGDIISAIAEVVNNVEDTTINSVLKQFLADTKFNKSTKKAIIKLKEGINNPLFWEWCDALIPCQDDSFLKYTLPAVLEKMSDVRRMQYELDTMMHKIWKDYLSVVAIVIVNIPLMRLINVEWYKFYVDTVPGKLIMVVTCVVLLISTNYVIRENKPVSVI